MIRQTGCSGKPVEALFHESVDSFVEGGVFADDDFGNIAFRVDHQLGGEAADVVGYGEVFAFFRSVDDIGPRQLVFSYGFFPFFFGVATVNTYTTSSLFLYLVYIFFISGMPLIHQPHQDPQKSSTTYLPLSEERVKSLPSSAFSVKSGAGFLS